MQDYFVSLQIQAPFNYIYKRRASLKGIKCRHKEISKELETGAARKTKLSSIVRK